MILMQDKPIYFVTSNKAKLSQLFQIPGSSKFNFIPIHLDISEIQSMDNQIVAEDKIIKAHDYISKKILNSECWVICEDTGYSFDNLNGFPGALIRFYHDSIGINGICNLHKGSKVSNTSVVAFADGYNIKIFSNTAEGTVPNSPRPTIQGILSDELEKIFIPDYPSNLTQYTNLALSEIPASIKPECSARAKSFSQLIDWLNIKINNEFINMLNNNITNSSDSDTFSDTDSEPDYFAEAISDNLSLYVLTGNSYDSDSDFEVNSP